MQLETSQWPVGAWDKMEGARKTATERETGWGGGLAETSLLSVTLLAFDVRGPSRVPKESLSSGPHSGAVEHRESLGEACWSGARGCCVCVCVCVCVCLVGVGGWWLGLSLLVPDRMVLTERVRGLIPQTILLQLGESLGGSAKGQTGFNTRP